MTFSSITVGIDFDPSNDAALLVAADLAKQFDAKLIGVAAADLPWSFYAQEAPTLALIEQLRADIARRLTSAEERFRSIAIRHTQQIEWRSAIATPVDYIARQARASDLVVAPARRNGVLLDPLMGQIDPGDLVMQAGRPVLVVPPETQQLNLKCVLVAWKDTREARRAVNDALPLLRTAHEVVVVEVIHDETERDSAHGRLDDVARWLARHGIATSVRVFDFPGGNDPVDKLWEYGADVVVAGAYGHARLREWVFGGFTDSLLRRSPRCAFLAH